MENNSKVSVGVGPMFALFLLFLGLKLGKVIDWSWWWVTAPLWGPVAIGLSIIAIIGIIALAVAPFAKRR